ncbi:MAG TPA: BlaI/MecI/CopY family transcriptional regulator [Bryobacteraceae bacterium]|nr:BlaI/MecI/CopY family transcriptional regulator [Bryobacteraceae bacterium]
MRRPAPPREIPPPLELECLKEIWRLGEGSVKDVRDSLAPRRHLAYTTVMTLLERLVRKGAASRRKTGRSFLYAPILSRETLRRLAVRELVESLFEGSEYELAAYLRNGELLEPDHSDGLESEPIAAGEKLDTALL